MGNKREAIGKKLRMEIFKRDSFTCQYCGRKAPDVILHIDHIKPVSKGGTNDIMNLVTSCIDCNLGKSDNELSDDSVIQKKRKQLDLLQTRKEQIEMMFEWQKGLCDITLISVNKLAEYWKELTGTTLTDDGRLAIRRLVKKYSIEEIIESINISVTQYIKYKNNNIDVKSVRFAFDKLSGILFNRKCVTDNPQLAQLHYIKAILHKKFYNFSDSIFYTICNNAIKHRITMESLIEHSQKCNSWSQWKYGIDRFIADNPLEDDNV